LRRRAIFILLPVVLLAGSTDETAPAFKEVHELVDIVRGASYPELKDAEITMHGLRRATNH
jgi:hypothetical protein